MGGSNKVIVEPIVNKLYCSQAQTILTIRRRPRLVNGGGFVVTNSSQKVLFKVEGCGTLGNKNELMVRDGDGDCLLLIRRKGGIVEALSMYKKWRGYVRDYEGADKLVFSLKEPTNSASSLCLVNVLTTIKVEPRRSDTLNWDFQIHGSFHNRACSIIDSEGNIVAQVGVLKTERESVRDVYNVVVQAGVDQAFVVAIVAVLDNINGESTTC